jgi:copper transport protein
MRRLAAAAISAGILWIAGSALAGPAPPIATAHAQLVSSVPGAGARLDEAPTELTLVFSERLDQLGSSVDVLDPDGRLLVRSGGTVDPADQRTLIVPLPPLADGLYTVDWRSLSADDGHTSQGFFNFGVGDVVVPAAGQQGGGDIHAGHDLGRATLETLVRAAAELGSMLALGLVLITLAVVRPIDRAAARVVASWSGMALIVAGLGAAMMVPLAAGSAAVDPLAYVAGTQSGQLLALRTGVGLVAGVLALVALVARERLSLALSSIGGALLIALLAVAGHGSGFESLAPVLFVVAHVTAAGCWLAGLLVLAWLVIGGRGRSRPLLAAAIPRFSAVALVSVGLFSMTGAYLWWLMDRAVIDLETGYGTVLLLKAVIAVAAVSLGGLSYLGWRPKGIIGTTRRIPVEAALAVAVVAVTALLASGSPPGPTRPVAISEAPTSGAAHLEARLSMLPARPGANQLLINLPDAHHDAASSVDLVLQRLDQFGQTQLQLVPSHGAEGGTSFTTDVLMPADSSWDASVRLIEGGQEHARARFAFAFDDRGLSQGEALPALDPLALVGLLLGAAGVLGLTIALAGGALPRADQRLSRRTLLVGSVTAVILALAAFGLGPAV